MKSAGELLKKARLTKKLSLEQIFKQTKISVKALVALEENRYHQLPPLTFSLGFVKNYAQALSLDPRKVVALFKRDYTLYQQKKILPPALKKKTASFWTPKTGLILGIIGLFLIFGFYVFCQLRNLLRPPLLDLELPLENQTVEEKILIKGKTDSDVSLTVNTQLISVDSQGEFEIEYSLAPGEETLLFVAQSRRHKITTLTRHLILEKE